MVARMRGLSLLAMALYMAALSSACIFKYGTAPDSLMPPHGGTHWSHGFNGDDWVGVDDKNVSWVCMTGSRQSPINIPAFAALNTSTHRLPSNLRTTWNYPDLVSNGSNIEVINNGHTIQVEWLYPYAGEVNIAVPAKVTNATKITAVLGMRATDKYTTVTAKPVQFHFHATSEHLMAGKYYPLELHIVHKITGLPACTAGCYSVTGVLFELTNGPDNKMLTKIWDKMPMRAGVINYLRAGSTIPLGSLIPNPDARQYVTYEGSLTTPPCSEGLLWHVMTTPSTISLKQWRKYQSAVGLKDCTLTTNATASSGSEEGHGRRIQSYRRVLSEEEPEGNPNDYNCTLAAYGTNFRNSQPINSRTIRLAQ